DANPPDQPAAGAETRTDSGGESEADERPATPVFQPWSSAFVRHAALWITAAIVGGLFLERLADSLAHRLASIFTLIVVSLFLSFAIEPAVGWLAPRGVRRGLGPGVDLLG